MLVVMMLMISWMNRVDAPLGRGKWSIETDMAMVMVTRVEKDQGCRCWS